MAAVSHACHSFRPTAQTTTAATTAAAKQVATKRRSVFTKLILGAFPAGDDVHDPVGEGDRGAGGGPDARHAVGVLIVDPEQHGDQVADGEAEGPAGADGDHQAAERVV